MENYFDEYNYKNCRNDFIVYDKLYNYYRKLIASYLIDLEEKGEEYKIKHIKKYYQIYNILHNILSVIYDKKTFEYTDKNLNTNDFYTFLMYTVECLMEDIYKFIKLFKDDKFNNELILYYKKDENNPEYYKIDLEECQENFNIYTKFKHFYII